MVQSILTAKHSIAHSQIFDLMKSNYKELDEQAVDIHAYLLEIYGAQASTELVSNRGNYILLVGT